MRKKMLLKIGAVLLALALIALVLFVANSFMGNPLSALLATRTAEEYVAQTYPQLDCTVERARYNFKFGEYLADVQSKTSGDTRFIVYLRGGRVLYDDYESRVTEGWNTLSRMEDEYSQLVVSLLQRIPGLEENTSMVMLRSKEGKDMIPPLDAAFDRTLFSEAGVTVHFQSEKRGLTEAAEILAEAYGVLEENGCHFASYDLFVESTDSSDASYLMITGCTAQDIAPEDAAAPDFLERLKAASEAGNSHISVSSKEG